MEKELLKTFETSKSNIEFINDTVDIVKEQRNLSKNIRLATPTVKEIVGIPNNAFAQYNIKTDEIYVFMNNINAASNSLNRELIELGLKDELDNGKKLYIMHLILHELEHAYQKKLSMNKEIDSPYVIISKDYFKEETNNISLEFYMKNHSLFPTERAAEISSYKIIQDMLKNSEYQRLYHYYALRENLIALKEYTSDLSPLFNYILKTKNFALLNELAPYMKDLKGLEDRLFYGLNISNEEFEIKDKEARMHLSKLIR